MDIGRLFENLGAKAGFFLERAGKFFRTLAAPVEKLIPAQMRGAFEIQQKPLLLGLAVLALSSLIVIGVVLVMSRPRFSQPSSAQDLAETFKPGPIPPEELFLPEEPDFLPEVLLERQPRKSWSVEDARPFWTDPLEAGEEIWRERLERAVDDLVENVP